MRSCVPITSTIKSRNYGTRCRVPVLSDVRRTLLQQPKLRETPQSFKGGYYIRSNDYGKQISWEKDILWNVEIIRVFVNITKEDVLRDYIWTFTLSSERFSCCIDARCKLLLVTFNGLKINPFSGNGDVNSIDIRSFCKSGNSNIFSSTNSPSGYTILSRKLHRPRRAILVCNAPVNRTSLAPPQGGERLRKEALISR